LQTAKNRWTAYELIEHEFLAIEGFIRSAHINLEANRIPEGLNENYVKVLVMILKICSIATEYATQNRIERRTASCK